MGQRGKGMKKREIIIAFNTESTRGPITFKPVQDSANYSKPRGKTR